MLLWSLLAATTASAAPAADDSYGVSFAGAPINDINISVSNVKQCGDAVISWTGTKGPVEVTIGTGGYYVGSTTLDTLSGLEGDSTTWKVNVPAGSDTSIFQVKDSTGGFKYQQGIAVEKSSDSSCLDGGSSSASSASPAPSSSESEQIPEPSTSSATSTSDSDSASSSTSDSETSPSETSPSAAPSSASPTPSTSDEATPSSESSNPEPVSSSGAGASPTSSDEVPSSTASPGGSDGSSPSPGGISSNGPSGTSSVSPSDGGSVGSATETSSSQPSSDVSTNGAGSALSAAAVSVSSKSNHAAHTSQPIIENTSAPPAAAQGPKTQTTVVPAPAPVVPGSGSKDSADAAKPSTAPAPVVTETISSAVQNAAQPAQSSAPSSSSTTSRSVVLVTSYRTNSSQGPAIETATVVGDSKGASLSLQDSGASRATVGVFATVLAVSAAAIF